MIPVMTSATGTLRAGLEPSDLPIDNILPHPQDPSKRDVGAARSTENRADSDHGPARLRAGRERSFARRVAAKALEIAAAPEADRGTLAGLLGCTADVVALTAEVMGGAPGAPRPGPWRTWTTSRLRTRWRRRSGWRR